jgi:hypothetical protein
MLNHFAATPRSQRRHRAQPGDDGIHRRQAALIHPAAHGGRDWRRKPEQVAAIDQGGRRRIAPTKIMLGESLLIDISDTRVADSFGRRLDAASELRRVGAAREPQDLNLHQRTRSGWRIGLTPADSSHAQHDRREPFHPGSVLGPQTTEQRP